MKQSLEDLIKLARAAPPMTAAEIREQRISFAFGNSSFDNPHVTREMVEAAHDEIYGAKAKEPNP
jgi:hypothetical protein